MGKHKKANISLKDSREIRKDNEYERRKEEKETIYKIKDLVPIFKNKDAKFIKKNFLRFVTGYLKFLQTFKKTSVKPLPSELDGVFHSLLCSDDISVFVCDGQMNIIFCSESSFKSLGYQPTDVICLKLSSLVHERDRLGFERELNEIKNDVIGSNDKKSKHFNITCRMIDKKNSRNTKNADIPDKYHLVRITGTVEYREDLLTKKVAIEKAKNKHLSIREEDIQDQESAILIRGSIGVIEDPDFLSSQINYILLNLSEYRLVMDLKGDIMYACHRMVSIIGYQPGEVRKRNAYEFIFPEDRKMSLFAHTRTLRNGEGVIVQRLMDINGKIVYLEVTGRLEALDDNVLFHTNAILLSEEEGEKRRLEFATQLTPHCHSTTIDALSHQVKVIGQQKLAQLTKNLAAAKIDNCASGPANSSYTDTLSTSSFSSPSTSTANSSFHSVLGESAENEFVGIGSITSGQSPGSSFSFASQPSPLSTISTSSSLPVLPSSLSLPSSSAQSPLSQSPLSQPSLSQSPPTQPFASQATNKPELQSTHFISDSSPMLLSTPPSTTISINCPAYNPQIIMRPTNEHLIQNQYYQFGSNHYNIIITTQTYPEQPTLFSQPVNQQIIFQPISFPQHPTYNYQNNSCPTVQNVTGLDINAELQRVNVNDFVYQLDSDSEQDLKN